MYTSVINVTQNQIIVKKLTFADTYFSRLRGLMFTSSLDQDEGLFITPCNQIHTHFMRFPIDVIFLDKDFIVLDKLISFSPWRISRKIKNAQYVLEMLENKSQNVNIGDKLQISNLKQIW